MTISQSWHRAFASFFSIIWFVSGIYFGLAGLVHVDVLDREQKLQNSDSQAIEYNGIKFKSKANLEAYIGKLKEANLFSWVSEVPEIVIWLSSSCFLGAFGGLIKIVAQVTYKEKDLSEVKYISIPFLGMLLGLVVLGLSYLIPTILITEKEIQIRQSTLMFLSLFVGLFSDRFLIWLESLFQKYLDEKHQPTT